MKILSAAQLRFLDEFTIDNESISSIDLMNRAANGFVEAVLPEIQNAETILIFCGTGNNGGDGFAVYRMLKEKHFNVVCYLVPFGEMSADCSAQFEQVKPSVHLWNETVLEYNPENTFIIDALLGVGTNRIPTGIVQQAIDWINNSSCKVISIDMPSGLAAEQILPNEHIVSADETITFHTPKLSFFLPETASLTGEWKVLDIGLNAEMSASIKTRYTRLTGEFVSRLLPKRNRFSHKGTFGHGLLIAGNMHTAGACLMSAEAMLRSGAGLLTVHTVTRLHAPLMTRLPEAMTLIEDSETLTGNGWIDFNAFRAIGIGPGMGINEGTEKLLVETLNSKKFCVIDSDALNVLAKRTDLLEKLHTGCVLTPHLKEFERLVGPCENSLDRLEKAIHFAQSYSCQLILKDAISAVVTSQGLVYFNSTGNSGMAKGGSGDVLTGIVLGLLTQGIQPEQAAMIAMYHHGLAGDVARTKKGERSMLATDLIQELRIE